MLQAFLSYLKTNYLLHPQARFIVACSGGVDSVVLCELCRQAQASFSIAHCNFGLRGAESKRDEAFVKSLGEKWNVPVFVKHFDTDSYGVLKKLSVQEAARELRYQWFEELQKETTATAILLAHHAKDNMETVLMNLFRGTGLHGLTGMPGKTAHPDCLRPLLQHTRKEIETFAQENQLHWVEDSSNSSSKYTRNFFRNEIIPAIQKIYPQAEEAVLATMERLKKTEKLYDSLVDGLLKKLLVSNGNEVRLPIAKLLQYESTSLPYEVLKKFGFGEKQVPELLKLGQSKSGRFIQNETCRIIKHRNWLIITPLSSAQPNMVVIEDGTKKIALPDRELYISTFEKKQFQLNPSPAVAQMDRADITFPLILRRWKPGDYFYPLGMRKKKKLSRFFIDLKLSTTEKETVWVIESDKRIIWVVGHRLDDRFKVTETTKNILQIKLSHL